jgi:DNA ligase 1
MNPQQFKPMLAATVKDISLLKFPLYASPKLDGVRAVVLGGIVYSRSMKPIPNKHVQARFGKKIYEGFDGELIVGSPTAKDVFNTTSKIVMSQEAWDPTLGFYLFDAVGEGTYNHRYATSIRHLGLQVAHQKIIHSLVGLQEYEAATVGQGYEGVMLRDPDGLYKQGRSTLKESYLMKLKSFADMEAMVIEVHEAQHNTNEHDNQGVHKKRTSHKAGMVGKRMLGSMTVRGLNGPFMGVEFGVGSGFTEQERIDMWREMDSVDRIIKVKYFPLGCKDAPRFPVFLGFRDPIDM